MTHRRDFIGAFQSAKADDKNALEEQECVCRGVTQVDEYLPCRIALGRAKTKVITI